MNYAFTPFRLSAIALAGTLACTLPAQALELESSDPETKIRLDFIKKNFYLR